MPRMVITHAVVDVERWLKGKAERAAAMGAAGTNVTDYVAADGSNSVAVTADIHDMDAAQAMMASPPPEIAALMEAHGVIRPFTAYIEAP
jgi:hypothetical protein